MSNADTTIGIRWGDVKDDGLDDFICIDPSGNMFVSINEGTNPPSWRYVGKFKDAVSGYPQGRVRLGDIDSDGRLDYCVIDDNGSLHCWRNGGILFDAAEYWQDMGIVFRTSDTLPDISMMQFVDSNGDFRSDIRWVDETGKVKTWINQRGDGAHWGDMTGTGNDDYVWIGADGKVVIFPNINNPPNTTGYPNWGVAQTLETGTTTARPTPLMASGNPYCTQGWGVGLLDLGHHFADVTGSGCVGCLCMKPDGTTTAWLNDCKADLFSLRNVGQVKFSEKLDRANHRFVDVDGDGLANFLWADKFTGDASVWINRGEQPENQRGNLGGSKFKWDKEGPLYAGSTRGSNLHYPNLGGQERADQVKVDRNTAKGYISFNACPAGGDDGGVVPQDPSLPGYEPQPQCSVNICRIDGTGYDGYAGATRVLRTPSPTTVMMMAFAMLMVANRLHSHKMGYSTSLRQRHAWRTRRHVLEKRDVT
ncbi:hypothetical protein F5Y19DRAFT_472646 [Xylariaceae sp. FL1651]|nr:hypothetical protein F5Y19DRAFT_472646 [Xylariaceae sp. FL1651]